MSKGKTQGKKATPAIGEATPEKHTLCAPWRPGQSGNPNGRPKGSRNKLGEAFIQDMFDAWQMATKAGAAQGTQGQKVIADVIEKDPVAFLRSMVAILPKEFEVNVNKYDTMSDEQLRAQFLAALREARSLGLDIGAGSAESIH